MIVLLGLVLGAALYGWGLLRVRRANRPFPRLAPLAFALALAVTGGVLLGPVDALADGSLAWHMFQHLVLISVAAPLLLFGAPLRLALAALPPSGAKRLARVLNSGAMRIVDHPVFGLLLLTFVLYGTHFSPLYELALEHAPIHAAEHILYLAAGLFYWAPIFAVAPAPHAPPHPVRILSLFLSIPMTAFLGFALYTTNRALYPHYAALGAGALADQQNGGAVMWLSAGTPVLFALLWCVADWGVHERRLGDALNAALDARAEP